MAVFECAIDSTGAPAPSLLVELLAPAWADRRCFDAYRVCTGVAQMTRTPSWMAFTAPAPRSDSSVGVEDFRPFARAG